MDVKLVWIVGGVLVDKNKVIDLCGLERKFKAKGYNQGVNALVISFSNCNLTCLDCEVPYTWKDIITLAVDIEDLYSRIKVVDYVVFTGGEPLLKKNWRIIIDIMVTFPNINYEIQTNGTLAVPDVVPKAGEMKDLMTIMFSNVVFNIKPRLRSQQEINKKLEPILITHNQLIGFEYVVNFLFESDDDLKQIEKWIKEYKIPNNKVYLQLDDNGVDSCVLTSTTKKFILDHGWNLSN
jgi:uncharacterized Fe-S cluster-containing radical SAM superfamily protein